jgi:hypothetical protein
VRVGGQGEGGVEVGQVHGPACAYGGDQRLCLGLFVRNLRRVGDGFVVFQQRQRCGEELGQRIEQLQLVGDRQFDVDSLDAVGVVTQPGSG